MSWASESGRAMFPFPEIGRTLVRNTVAGARAIVARAESYERVPDMGHSRKYSTVSPPCRNKSVRKRPTLPFASSAYAIRASRPGCPRKACSRPPTSRTSVRDRTAMSLAASWNRLLPTTCGMESSGTVRRSNSPSRRLISSTRRTDCASRCGVTRPAATAAVIARTAESGSAGISSRSEPARNARTVASPAPYFVTIARSEEHTSELQSRSDLVCRLLLEKKKKVRRNQVQLYQLRADRVEDMSAYHDEQPVQPEQGGWSEVREQKPSENVFHEQHMMLTQA